MPGRERDGDSQIEIERGREREGEKRTSMCNYWMCM